jgi:hypothetical protein
MEKFKPISDECRRGFFLAYSGDSLKESERGSFIQSGVSVVSGLMFYIGAGASGFYG